MNPGLEIALVGSVAGLVGAIVGALVATSRASKYARVQAVWRAKVEVYKDLVKALEDSVDILGSTDTDQVMLEATDRSLSGEDRDRTAQRLAEVRRDYSLARRRAAVWLPADVLKILDEPPRQGAGAALDFAKQLNSAIERLTPLIRKDLGLD